MIETPVGSRRTGRCGAAAAPAQHQQAAGFSEDSSNACLRNQTVLDGIKEVDSAAQFGVTSTPTFFINGKKYSGGMTIEDMEKSIAPFLKADCERDLTIGTRVSASNSGRARCRRAASRGTRSEPDRPLRTGDRRDTRRALGHGKLQGDQTARGISSST
jgi:hypothetical protein